MKNLQLVPVALCRMIIGGTFWVASRLFYSIEFHGLEYDTRAPRTYLAISHRRDLDPIISLPTLLSHWGWRAWAGDIHFVLRDDAFSPGYLAHLCPPRAGSRVCFTRSRLARSCAGWERIHWNTCTFAPRKSGYEMCCK